MTLDCVRLTRSRQFSLQIIHNNVGLKCFFCFIYQNVWLLLLLYIVIFTYISQGSVEMHLQCGGIYNNHVIANGPQCVPVKEFCKSVNNW